MRAQSLSWQPDHALQWAYCFVPFIAHAAYAFRLCGAWSQGNARIRCLGWGNRISDIAVIRDPAEIRATHRLSCKAPEGSARWGLNRSLLSTTLRVLPSTWSADPGLPSPCGGRLLRSCTTAVEIEFGECGSRGSRGSRPALCSQDDLNRCPCLRDAAADQPIASRRLE